MNKEWLFSIANKGPHPYADAIIDVQIERSKVEVFEGREMVRGTIKAINPFTTDRHFGDCFADEVTDADCVILDDLISSTIAHMKKYGERADRPPITLERISRDEVVKIVDGKRQRHYGYERYRDSWFCLYSISGGEWDSPVCVPVTIDGVTYKAIYSFWLGKPVYLFDQPNGIEKKEGGFQA